MGPADIEYFDFLIRSTQVAGADSDSKECVKRDRDSLDELHNRLQYVIESVGYHNMDVDDEYTEAMTRKLMQEQEIRNDMYQREFLKMFGKVSKEELKKEAEKIESRTEDAKWHISFYSDQYIIYLLNYFLLYLVNVWLAFWSQKHPTEFECL
jgi:NurA-like 5'-3' nuclease